MTPSTYITLALKTLPAKGRRNGIKILTLSLGLAVGLVLASKVCFEQTYDDFHTAASRIVYLTEMVEQNGEYGSFPQTSGGIAPLMKEHYPEVEEATRMTFFESGASLIDAETGQRYAADDVKLADSCFFRIFDRECLAGNITTSLGIALNVAISSDIALAMAQSRDKREASREVMGRQFTIGSRGTETVFTIAGVFERFPANSSFRPDVIVSLPSIGLFMYDGTEETIGNDRYQAYLRLREGTTAEALNAKMESFVEKYLPVEEMKEHGFAMTYEAKPLTGYHLESADVRNSILVLGIVAFALLPDLFAGKPLLLAIGIVLLVVLLNGYVPTHIFDRIPVATAFRRYRENRRAWKHWLLITEFALVAFLCVLVGVISVQYDSMVNADLGFSYEDSVEVATPEASASQHQRLMHELRAMPEVADACFAIQTVFPGYNGNNIRIPGGDRELFNANDLNYVDDHWLNVMGIQLREGRNFNPLLSADQEVIVDTRFAEKLKATTGWSEVIGRQVTISAHGDNVTIVGVIEPFIQGRFDRESEELFLRPKMIFYCNPDEPMGKYHYPFQYVRLHRFTAERYQRLRDVVTATLPDQAAYTNPFQTALISRQQDTLETRNAILVGGIITLLIALFSQIRLMFQRETLLIALPSALIGCIAGSIVALRWEENFTLQVGLPWWLPAAAIAFTLLIVALVSDLLVCRVANANPVESIKTE